MAASVTMSVEARLKGQKLVKYKLLWLYRECNYISICIQEPASVIWNAVHIAVVVAN